MSTTPTVMLGELVRPRDSYLRAANLERHHEQAAHYIPTGRALEVLRRVLNAVEDPTGGRAWSLTGPYGAGKSSFGLFIRTLFGPVTSRRNQAELALGDADPGLLQALRAARTTATNKGGFVLATTTCQQEPLSAALLRALDRGVKEYWPTGCPRPIQKAMRVAHAVQDARSIADAAELIAFSAPLLLVLDEFGKTLEHFAAAQVSAAESEATDLFVLQELAERASGSSAAPIFLFTMQHLAFDDYVRKASATQRREWGKVQGRFEDIPFLETSEQSLRLVAGALDDSATPPDFMKRKVNWARRSLAQTEQLGLASHLPGGASTLSRCYPLHPTALLALPELCARLGQHGRTLFSFLASTESSTANAFLNNTPVPATKAHLPVIHLHYLYDFFAGPGQALAAGIGGSRWREIDERVREAQNLSDEDLRCLKTVGLLNLLGHAGGLKASADQVAYALGPAEDGPQAAWRSCLSELEARGWLTYRAFADEYRLWQGSDVDLRGRVADAREQLRSTSAAELLSRLHDAPPVIAAKHSQRVGMLRYFTVGFVDAVTPLPTLPVTDPADGSLVYFLEDPTRVSSLGAGQRTRPVVVGTSEDASNVRDAAIEVAAALAVLDQQEVVEDRVARRELQDRVADAKARLTAAQARAFRPGASGVRFYLLGKEGPVELDSSLGLSRLLSSVCDDAYHQSPEIRNEMLGRRELTSQGAKARRQLLDLMLTMGDEDTLGMTHYGPERAMYEAVLRHTGLHKEVGGSWNFDKPNYDSTLTELWGAIAQIINPAVDAAVGVDVLYQRLMAPPIGIKEGPIPVLLAAFLLQRSDDVAIYEDGTFQPNLTADLLERLLKNPKRFSLKGFSTAGSRGKVLAVLHAVGSEFSSGAPSARTSMRNTSILRAATPLLTFASKLPDFTVNTTAVSELAAHVRSVLLSAREPDVLVFEDLPRACGFAPLSSRTKGSADAAAELATVLRDALTELQQAYPRRLAEIGRSLAAELDLPEELGALRRTLAARAEPLEDKVLDPKLRSFLFTAGDVGLSDDAWCESMGLCIADRPPASWRDADGERLIINMKGVVASFQRVQALHFESAAQGTTDGFDVRRITQTSSDGREVSRVVYVDLTSRPEVMKIADQAMREVVDLLGPQGVEALLEVLAARILVAPTADANFEQKAMSPKLTRERRHG